MNKFINNFMEVDISQSVTMCLSMAIIFFVIALIFAIGKDKASGLVAGFNGFSKRERENYDKVKITLDMRNLFFLWTSIFAIGAVLCFFILPQLVWVAYIIWIISLGNNFYVDPKSAFEKYKLED